MVICGSRRRSRGIRLPEPVADTGLQVPGADVVQDQVGRAQPARATNAADSYQVTNIPVGRPSRPPVRPGLRFSERTRSIRSATRRAKPGRGSTRQD